MEIQELIQIVAAVLSGFLVTEGVKSLNKSFGGDSFSGFAPALTAFSVTLFVLLGNLLLGYIPAEYADEAANIAKSALAVLSAFGIHRTAARISG
jgi:hypothetical protein